MSPSHTAARNRRPWFLLPALLALFAGQATASPQSLRQELTRFTASAESRSLAFCALFTPIPELPGTTGGPLEVDLPDSGDAIARGSDLPLVPASVAKLTTASLAFEVLGPAHTFKTRFLAGGSVRGGTLDGDLIVVGGCDPFLVSERLWLLTGEFRKLGLREVKGRLVVDTSVFAPPDEDPNRWRDREVSDRPYAARLTPLATNFNSAAFRLVPGAAPGAPAEVSLDPLPCSHLRIQNGLSTSARGSAEDYTVRLEPDSLGEIVRVVGTIPVDAAPQIVYRSVNNADAFAASLLRAFLERSGVVIQGPTVFGPAPPQAAVLIDFASLPLTDLLASAARHSNNFMADLVCMNLSDSASGKANLTGGADRITRWLRQEFGAGAEVRQVDGSGLNPASRLTGAVLQRLLIREWNSLRVQPDLVSALAVPGEEGTLKKRFADGGPFLRAKTGTMGNPMASGIAGYLADPARGAIAFVILMNPGGSGWDIPRLQSLQEAWIREYVR